MANNQFVDEIKLLFRTAVADKDLKEVSQNVRNALQNAVIGFDEAETKRNVVPIIRMLQQLFDKAEMKFDADKLIGMPSREALQSVADISVEQFQAAFDKALAKSGGVKIDFGDVDLSGITEPMERVANELTEISRKIVNDTKKSVDDIELSIKRLNKTKPKQITTKIVENGAEKEITREVSKAEQTAEVIEKTLNAVNNPKALNTEKSAIKALEKARDKYSESVANDDPWEIQYQHMISFVSKYEAMTKKVKPIIDGNRPEFKQLYDILSPKAAGAKISLEHFVDVSRGHELSEYKNQPWAREKTLERVARVLENGISVKDGGNDNDPQKDNSRLKSGDDVSRNETPNTTVPIDTNPEGKKPPKRLSKTEKLIQQMELLNNTEDDSYDNVLQKQRKLEEILSILKKENLLTDEIRSKHEAIKLSLRDRFTQHKSGLTGTQKIISDVAEEAKSKSLASWDNTSYEDKEKLVKDALKSRIAFSNEDDFDDAISQIISFGSGDVDLGETSDYVEKMMVSLEDVYAKSSDEIKRLLERYTKFGKSSYKGAVDAFNQIAAADEEISNLIKYVETEFPDQWSKFKNALKLGAKSTSFAEESPGMGRAIDSYHKGFEKTSKSKETMVFINTQTGDADEVVEGKKHKISFSEDLVKQKSDKYDMEIHSHTGKTAAPSVEDVEHWAKNLDFITKYGIRAGEELLAFDFSGFNENDMASFLQKYKDLDRQINEQFHNMTIDEKVALSLEHGSIREATQVFLRRGLEDIINTHFPSVMESIKMPDLPIQRINASSNEDFVGVWASATDEVKDLIKQIAILEMQIDELDAKDEDASDLIDRSDEISDRLSKEVVASLNGEDWDDFKNSLVDSSVEQETGEEITSLHAEAEERKKNADAIKEETRATEELKEAKVQAASVGNPSEELEKSQRIISVQKQWLEYLDGALNDDNFKTDGKKAATEQLSRITKSLVDYRRHPEEYAGEEMRGEKLVVMWNKAYEEAKRQGVAQSTLTRNYTDAVNEYDEALKKLQAQQQFSLQTIAREEEKINALQKPAQDDVVIHKENTAAIVEETNAAQELNKEKSKSLLPTADGLEAHTYAPSDDQKEYVLKLGEEYRAIMEILKRGDSEFESALIERAKVINKIMLDTVRGRDGTIEHMYKDVYGGDTKTTSALGDWRQKDRLLHNVDSNKIDDTQRQAAIDLIYKEIEAEKQLEAERLKAREAAKQRELDTFKSKYSSASDEEKKLLYEIIELEKERRRLSDAGDEASHKAAMIALEKMREKENLLEKMNADLFGAYDDIGAKRAAPYIQAPSSVVPEVATTVNEAPIDTTGEQKQFSDLKTSVDNVTASVNMKTKAFETEGAKVGEVVDGEIKKLGDLETKVKSVKTNLEDLLNNIKAGSDDVCTGLSNITVNVNNQEDEEKKPIVSIDKESLRHTLSEVIYNVKVANDGKIQTDTTKTEENGQFSIDEAALESVLNRITYNVKVVQDVDATENKVSIDESVLKNVLQSIIYNVKVTQDNADTHSKTISIDENVLKSILQSIVYNVKLLNNDQETSKFTIDENVLKSVLQGIVYNVKIAHDDNDKESNRIAINESELEGVLRKVFSDVLNREDKKDKPKNKKEPWALEKTLNTTIKGILDKIQTNTAKKESVEVTPVKTKVGNVLATENTLGAIKTAVEAINKKVVKGSKVTTKDTVKTTKDSQGRDAQILAERIATQKLALAKFKTELETSGRMTEDVAKKIRGLSISLGMVKDGKGLTKWGQKFQQQKLSVGITDINGKESIAEQNANIKEWISLSKQLGELDAKINSGLFDDAIIAQAKQERELVLRRIDEVMGLINSPDAGFTKAGEANFAGHYDTVEAEKSKQIGNLISQYEKLGQLQARAETSGAFVDREKYEQLNREVQYETEILNLHEAQNSELLEALQARQENAYISEKDIEYAKAQKRLFAEYVSLVKQIGKLDGIINSDTADAISKLNARAEKDALMRLVDDIRPQLDLTREDLISAGAASMAGEETSSITQRQKALIDLAKQHKELGKLQAQEAHTQVAELQNKIDAQKLVLQLTQEEQDALAKITKSAKRDALNKQTDKDEKKRLANEKKMYQKQAMVGKAGNAVGRAENTWLSAIALETEGKDAIPAEFRAQIDGYRGKLEELRKKQEEVRNTAVPVTDAQKEAFEQQTKELVDQINSVNKLTDEISGLVSEYQKLSGSNVDETKTKTTTLTNESPLADYETQLKQYVKSITDGKGQIKSFNAETKTLTYTVKTGKNEFTEYTAAVRNLDHRMVSVQGTTKRTETFFEATTRKMKELTSYFSGMAIFNRIGQELRRGIQYVREIDLALTELKKVTDESEESYDRFLDTAAKTGERLGSTISAVTEATATFAKLGYSMEQATEMAEAAIVYKNVGDNIASTEDAADSIISTMKGFKLEATESMEIVDRFNEVGE